MSVVWAGRQHLGELHRPPVTALWAWTHPLLERRAQIVCGMFTSRQK